MDQGTEILISLASAAAANCIPCLDHYFQEAKDHNLSIEDVQKTMEISAKIKGASAMFTRRAIEATMGDNSVEIDCGCTDGKKGASTEPCC